MPRGGGIGKIMLTFDDRQYVDAKLHADSYSEPLASYLRGMLNDYLDSLGHLEVFPQREPELITYEDDPEATVRRLRAEATESLRAGAEERRLEAYRLQRDMIR